MSEGRLSVCATPIGNLGDVSERLAQTLNEADVVYAEDTRRTSKLLAHVGAHPRLRSLFVGNERVRSNELLTDVSDGMKVVLVSDAGMPTVSDPGAEAVSAVRGAGLSVTVVPGPSAVTTAITAAGFGGDRFVFEGFLPRKGKERTERISRIAQEDRAVVLFVSPHRIGEDLASLASVITPERRVAVLREMTKLHEEAWVGSIAEALEHWVDDVKGEITMVIGAGEEVPISDEEAIDSAHHLVANGVSASQAARQVAEETGVSRRVIYQALVDPQS